MIKMLAALALFASANSCTPQMKTYKVKMKGVQDQGLGRCRHSESASGICLPEMTRNPLCLREGEDREGSRGLCYQEADRGHCI